jgi:hypothetical protein
MAKRAKQRSVSSGAKSSAAKLLGRLGGLEGGPARAKALSGTERSRIASMGGAAQKKESHHSKRVIRQTKAELPKKGGE